MKKLYYRIQKRGKSEDGQSMLEFVLVFPIFVLLLAMIIDFGWYFYNRITVENSARNAARVACVEYDRVAYDSATKSPAVATEKVNEKEYTIYGKTYKLSDYQSVLDGTADEEETADSGLTDQEIRILNQVKDTLPSNFSGVYVTLKYSYDKEFLTSPSAYEYKVSNRSNGDVSVYVSGTHHAFTHFVGLSTMTGMKTEVPITCKAVYKVEANSFSSDD